MSSGGKWDPVADVKKLAENPVDTIAAAIVNTATLGTVGYEDGRLTSGVQVKALDEAVGEVSGRNIARKSAMQAQDALAASKAAAEKERQGQIQMQEAKDRQLSNKAASLSKKAQGTMTAGTGTSGVEQQMAVDFLGL